jgi:hypothetical protein
MLHEINSDPLLKIEKADNDSKIMAFADDLIILAKQHKVENIMYRVKGWCLLNEIPLKRPNRLQLLSELKKERGQ